MKVKDIIKKLQKCDQEIECLMEIKMSINFTGADSILVGISNIYTKEYNKDSFNERRKYKLVHFYYEE